MAEAVSSISCSICLYLLKDPVTIPCGHSYCMSCIKGCLDQEDDMGIYSCPQCRQTFKPRPVLNRTIILAELVENLKKTKLQAAPPDHYYAGPGDAVCDFCTGRKLKATKSCLMCLASYCETHLQSHYEVAPLKRHKLVQASKKLEEKFCSHHDKLLEIYCCTDQQCICYLCTMDEHKGHDTVSAALEWTEKQHSAQATVEDSEKIFTELIHYLEKRRSELKELIRAQEKTEVNRAEELLKQLEKEVAEMRRRDVELKQLLDEKDHINFLQSFQSLGVSPGSEVLPSITVYPHISFENVKKSVSELKNQIQDVCKKEMDRISGEVATVQIGPLAESKNREDFLTYSCQLTLDPNTAHYGLCLSEGNRRLSWSNKGQFYTEHLDRFNCYNQVLCREGLSGVCYWEVEWSGEWVNVAVSYKTIKRKGGGNKCFFGYNDQSWMLHCSSSSFCFWHNNNRTDIPVPCSSRVGVYLDHRAGTLSFYSVSDTMTLLYRVQTTFTQPLYPGFSVYKGNSLEILMHIN
ncbi:tripartite motif-containing protein 16 isoform X2 [Esox lucius]|uniref:Tripartite motif-containing protein 16-like n=1 Tax=Esox lucius TaxID=8010 RepID=A0A6Q2X4A2_ESOLU|nr:tripartite motif-containing protein 16 isoform X2 [Esox lucius]